jgi:hypothetical protein
LIISHCQWGNYLTNIVKSHVKTVRGLFFAFFNLGHNTADLTREPNRDRLAVCVLSRVPIHPSQSQHVGSGSFNINVSVYNQS